MENSRNRLSADWRHQVRMLVGASFGFVVALFVGVASADGTPASAPVEPAVSSVPAVVVSAGADDIDTNAVARLSASTRHGSRNGTAVRLDDGRIGTVAHALIDARSIRVGETWEADLDGDSAVVHVIDEIHDLAAIDLETGLASLPIATAVPAVGESVALAGFGRDERLTVVAGDVLYRGPGAAYGSMRPDIVVVGGVIVEEGWSGGPVVNADGEVVGLIVSMEAQSGVAIVVPITHLPRLAP